MAGVISLAVLALFCGVKREHFSANGILVFQEKEYWRLFTTTLLHSDLKHFAHNAFYFGALAALLHNYFGLWIFPVLSFLAGGLINLVALSFYHPSVHLVGVSGVIYFMAAFWLTLYIKIERRQKLSIRLIHALAVSFIFLFPEFFENNVSYLAHGLGYLFGILSGMIYYFLFEKEIRARDEWIEVKKDSELPEGFILPDEIPYHHVKPEEDSLCERASDCVRSQPH
jgi:rhomboid protease GluP